MVSDSRRPTAELNPHPLIYKHPETGKPTLCFHLGMTDSFILDHGTPNARELDDDETETILRSIHSEIVGKNADLQYKHEWQPGDFIISDNQRYSWGGPQNFGRVCCSMGPRKLMFYCFFK